MFDFMPPELAVYLGLFFGCLARALFPFFKKQSQAASEGKAFKWERRYYWTFGFAIFASFVASMFLLTNFEIPATNIFPVAFLMGWSSEDIINKLVK